ncbi:MAG: nuclear transport factor 2 family protein [Gammaproteobacteria bacterium]|nr:nuclear transport factor 2 family protein [Gammaproteobacteria bacterium]
MTDRRAELTRLVEEFTACFNNADLDGLMTFFADDAVYEEVNGPVNRGKAAIRRAFEPLFSGQFGRVQFIGRDFFIDPTQDKVMASWDCHLVMDGVPKVLEGLDNYQFRGEKVVFKRAYCKARQPRYVDAA